MEINYEEYIPMMQKIAWSFAKTTGLPFEELFSAAYMVTEHAHKTYDPKKGEFSTYLYRACQTRLIDECAAAKQWKEKARQKMTPYREEDATILGTDTLGKEEENENRTEVEEPTQYNEAVTELTPEHLVLFKELLSTLSPESRLICDLVLNSPHEYVTHRPKLARGLIRDRLRELGWSWAKIWNCFREIKWTLSEPIG